MSLIPPRWMARRIDLRNRESSKDEGVLYRPRTVGGGNAAMWPKPPAVMAALRNASATSLLFWHRHSIPRCICLPKGKKTYCLQFFCRECWKKWVVLTRILSQIMRVKEREKRYWWRFLIKIVKATKP